MYQNCKFQKSHLVNMYVFLLYQYYTSHWCYCVKELWCCFPIQWLIFIYYNNGAVDMQICFWQEFSVKSLILGWPLRPVGLLSFKVYLINSRFRYKQSIFWEKDISTRRCTHGLRTIFSTEKMLPLRSCKLRHGEHDQPLNVQFYGLCTNYIWFRWFLILSGIAS